MPFLSLRARALLVLAFAFLVMFGVIFYHELAQREARLNSVKESVRYTAETIVSEQRRIIDYTDQVLLNLMPLIPQYRASARCDALLATKLKSYPEFRNLGIVALNGDIVCTATPFSRPINIADRDYFQQALKTPDMVVSGALISRSTGIPTFAFMRALRDPAGRVEAFYYVALDISWLQRAIAKAKHPEGSRLGLVDANGMVLARFPDPEGAVGKSIGDSAGFQAMLALRDSGVAEEITPVDGVRRVFAVSTFVQTSAGPVLFYVGVPKRSVTANIDREFVRDLGVLLTLIIVTFGAIWFGSERWLLRPIAVLSDAARRLGEGDLSARAGLKPADGELGRLARVFDEMAEQRKRTEDSLRAAMQRLDSALENSPLAVIEWTTDEFRITRWSDEATTVFGWTAQETLGKRIDDLPWVYEDDWPIVRDVMAEMLAGKRPRNVTRNRNVRKGGTVIHCEWYNSVVLDAAGKLQSVLSLVLDVTERKYAEQALQEARTSAEGAKAEAEQANQAKDHFLAVLSHELRTPLTPVLAAVELLQRRPMLDAAACEPLEVIRRNVQLQAHLIDDLLDLTRIAQGKLELKRKTLEIRTVIERAVEIARPDMQARRLNFGVDLKGGPHWVDGDAARLQQVIWNLLTNAVKFTPEGGFVGLRCERRSDQVVIEVSDSGIGIEPEAADRIFHAFEQGGRAITRQFGGLGLGLAIAKQLIELHGGTISAHSEGRGKGALFRVSLPLSFAGMATQAPKRAPSAQHLCKRILLVEDNCDTLAMMKMLLEECGFQIATATNVAQALKAAQSQEFDLLISDLGLPDRTGIELMRELRRCGSTLRGIALSGYGQDQDIQRSKAAGFSAHLTKPSDADVLLETVSRLLSVSSADSVAPA